MPTNEKSKSAGKYIDGLKITSSNYCQRENRWNEINYSWYSLKQFYGIDTCFTVDFTANIARKYTARGLYRQQVPFEQSLLISCVCGCAAIIVLDLREKSRTYMRHNRFILDGGLERRALYIPRGVAYGFITLEDDTCINFKADNYCETKFEQIFNLMDPQYALRVPYPDKNGENTLLSTLLAKGELLISAQDRSAPWIIDVTGIQELVVEGGDVHIEEAEKEIGRIDSDFAEGEGTENKIAL